jgi:cytoplasmic iron level regulating protein YaaA (DUF328/UPF0246 family)
MYYSAFDLQTGDYFHTGRNSKSKQECIDDIFDWLTEDSEEDLSKLSKQEKAEMVSIYEVRIDKHKELLSKE